MAPASSISLPAEARSFPRPRLLTRRQEHHVRRLPGALADPGRTRHLRSSRRPGADHQLRRVCHQESRLLPRRKKAPLLGRSQDKQPAIARPLALGPACRRPVYAAARRGLLNNAARILARRQTHRLLRMPSWFAGPNLDDGCQWRQCAAGRIHSRGLLRAVLVSRRPSHSLPHRR